MRDAMGPPPAAGAPSTKPTESIPWAWKEAPDRAVRYNRFRINALTQ